MESVPTHLPDFCRTYAILREVKNMKTSKRMEDYLKYILILGMTQDVHGVNLAEAMGISKPTVSVSLRQLEHDGYVRINRNRSVSLTETGRAIAIGIYEKHRVFENMLLDIGVSEEAAHENACHLEHAVSTESFEALKKTLLAPYVQEVEGIFRKGDL